MPDLWERLQSWATRNLPDPPAVVFPPVDDPKKPKKPKKKDKKPPKPDPTPGTTPVAEKERAAFVSHARALIGAIPYCSPPRPALYNEPDCTDCSGLVAWSYFQATGRRIPGDGGSHEQFNLAGRLLRRGNPGEEWLPGDVLFYNTTGEKRAGNFASHSMVYLGNGLAASAMNPRQGIIETPTTTQYWNSRFLGARRMWEAEPPKPDPDPDPDPQPGGPKPVTPGAAPITPSIGAPVTFQTPYRAIAAIGAQRWSDILTDAESPMAREAASIHAACGPLLTVAGAQSYKESQYGKAAGGNNPLGLMELDGSTLMRFPDWTSAFAEWWRRMTDTAYKPGAVGVYLPRDMTLEQFIVIYVGGPGCWSSRGATCGNGETWTPGGGPNTGSINLYLYQTKARINRYLDHYDADPLWPDFEDGGVTPAPTPEGYTAHKIEGTAQRLMLPSDIDFNILITPAWRTCNRSGRRLQYSGIRQHETGNPRPGTGAKMHAEWQYNGTQGHPNGCIAVHFYADDHAIYQTLPINEQGIHSGDAGNQTQIAIESAVNSDGDWSRTYRNTVALEAALHDIHGTGPEQATWMHHENSGCPPNLRKVWPQFERDIRAAQNRLEAAK